MAYNAATGYGGIAIETTAGTAVGPDLFYPFQEMDIDFQDEMIEWQEIRGSRQAKQAQDGPLRPSVTLSGAAYPDGAFAALLTGTFGAVTSVKDGATTAHDHTYRDAGQLLSFSVERSTGFSDDVGSKFSERIAGCKVESFGLSASFGEQVSFNATLQATKAPALVTPVARTAAIYPTVAPLYFGAASVKVNGVPNSRFKSLSIEFTNTLTRQETLNGERVAYEISEGAMEATLSGTMVFTDETYYDYLLEGQAIAADIFLGNKENASVGKPMGLALNYPRLRVTRHSTPFSAGETVEADVEFKVLFDPTTKKSVSPVLTNTSDGTKYQ